MGRLKTNSIIRKGNSLPNRPMAESVEDRVSQVKGLIRERRRTALAYRRSQSEVDRDLLEKIDHELAGYNIDIPAIQQCVARRKSRNPDSDTQEATYPHPLKNRIGVDLDPCAALETTVSIGRGEEIDPIDDGRVYRVRVELGLPEHPARNIEVAIAMVSMSGAAI